jgi:hypothetical protein
MKLFSKTNPSIAFCSMLIVVALASFSLAQNPPAAAQQGQQYLISVVRVQEAAVREWQELVKNEWLPAQKKAGVGELHVWSTDTLGEFGEFRIARAIKDITELDEPSPLVKALGQMGADALMAKLRRLTVSSRSYISTTRLDLSIAAPAGYTPKLAVLNQAIAATGRNAEFEERQKKLTAAIGKTNAKALRVTRINMGGNRNEYDVLALFDSFTDISQFGPALGKAMAEANLPAQPGVVANSETIVLRYVPELSLRPAAQKTAR